GQLPGTAQGNWKAGVLHTYQVAGLCVNVSHRLFGTHLPTRVSELAASTHKSYCALRPLFSGKRH
ncbi:MAG: hypothetical protein WBX77_10270, partial [Pseudolabrys sp.]